MLIAHQLGKWAEQTALNLLQKQNYVWVTSNIIHAVGSGFDC